MSMSRLKLVRFQIIYIYIYKQESAFNNPLELIHFIEYN